MSATRGEDVVTAGDVGQGFNWVVPFGPVRFHCATAEGEQRVEISLQGAG